MNINQEIDPRFIAAVDKIYNALLKSKAYNSFQYAPWNHYTVKKDSRSGVMFAEFFELEDEAAGQTIISVDSLGGFSVFVNDHSFERLELTLEDLKIIYCTLNEYVTSNTEHI